ncbi:MAG: hypothetical protein F6K28_57845 [Microcoleus sp. SIO2G3]|nr:hypothetical protein [Microcoleus sp. SIO2G3]
MKARIDGLLTEDEKLQQFFGWVSQKSLSVGIPYKLVNVRFFYSQLGYAFNLDVYQAYDLVINRVFQHLGNIYYVSPCDNKFSLSFDLDRALTAACAATFTRYLRMQISYALDCAFVIDVKLEQLLHQLEERLPRENEQRFKAWWQENGQAWIEQLRSVMVNHRNIGHDWQFSDAQMKLWQQYYDTNILLVNCLNSDCYVSREVRQEIEETLLLPITEIEKRKQLNQE